MRLEADPAGIPIYERIGFVHELESPRYRLDAGPRTPTPSSAGVCTSDVDEVAPFDTPHFGDDRKRLLREFLSRARAVYEIRKRGALSGYLVVQRSAAGARIGPWIAIELSVAENLLQAALSGLHRGSVVVALPGINRQGCALLERCGFVRTSSSYRMVRGPAAAQGKPENVYAIAGGALG